MWKGPDGDPGGGGSEESPPDQSGQSVADLKEQYDQSQLLLAQLKEVLRKSDQTTVTQEKFELYANTLSRAKRNKMKKGDTSKQTSSHRVIDTPATEKINLLRQQLEENKVKLAERGKSQKGIEEMVIQLKAQLDDSQQLISQTPLNLSLVENKVDYNRNSSSEELYNILLNKERYITDLSMKVQKLEANVLDLQENLKEKDAVIDARTKAITLMTESLTKKGKSTLDTLDETKEQMRKMQETFVTLEADMKARQLKLLDDLKLKNLEIAKSQETIKQLERERNDLQEELEELKQQRESGFLEDIQKVSETSTENVEQYLSEIKALKDRIRQLEEQNSKKLESSESAKSSPQKSGKKNKRGQRSRSRSQESKVKPETKIMELQQIIDEEKSENKTLTTKISELEETIKELNTNIADLQRKRKSSISSDIDSDEMNKLKKQLEDQNKNMIKVKAQHKSKVKELTKKIEAFKKVSDVNAEIVRLESENHKLYQQIAELEEEKGNLQLKLVESDSSKDSSCTEELEELKKNLSEKLEELQLRDETIQKLQSEIQSSKTEIETLKEKLNNLSHIQNVQVTSEMTSIQYEEQLDKLENEKKQIIEEKEKILSEFEELQEKLESLKKEKQEMISKLESYVQENMELIDKLEKLSTEKVSSAESIEIVEGLTQQEKLEIEQYQKNLNLITGNLKVSEENLSQNADLNESVNQLTEETSELLQKIELFTVERREVMEKMETLTADNNSLSLKIKEIENNRDLLAETYEQLQNEKESLDNRIENLEKENEELKAKLEKNEPENCNEVTENVGKISEKLTSLEKQYNDLLLENEELRKDLKEKSETVHEKDAVETELRHARNKIEELEKQIRENLDEVTNYQNIIEQNKNELINSSGMINSLQNRLESTENDLQAHKNDVAHLNSIIADLNNAIMNFENENKKLFETNELVEKELAVLKSSLNENMQQAEDYEEELKYNSETINSLNKDLKTLTNKVLEFEHLLGSKDDEIKKLIKERENKEVVIENLQQSIQEKDKAFHKLRDEIKEKYLTMQKQMNANTDSIEDIKIPLQNTIDELTAKNKEQHEKMKKIAANLKKKQQLYQELDEKFKNLTIDFEKKDQECHELEKELKHVAANLEKRNQEYHELDNKFKNQMEVLEIKEQRCQELENKFEEIEGTLTEKTEAYLHEKQELENSIRQLEIQKRELENTISQFNHTEVVLENLKEELASNISDDDHSNTPDIIDLNYLKSKIRELKMIKKNQTNEISKYQEKVNQLEDSLASFEKLRQDFEAQIYNLNAELTEKNNRFGELAESENILLEKLTTLTSECETSKKLLHEAIEEKENLAKLNQELMDQNEKLKQKVHIAQDKVHTLSSYEQNLAEIQEENINLTKQITHFENEIKRLQSELESSSLNYKKQIEMIDSDWQQQLNELLKEKNDFSVQIEKLTEQISELAEKDAALESELNEYKSKLEATESELESLNNEHQANLTAANQVRLQISTLLSENEDLRRECYEINQQIETYKNQIEQMQAQNASILNQLMNVSSSQNNEMAIVYNDLNTQLEETISEKQQLILQLQESRNEFQHVYIELNSVKDTLRSKNEEIEYLKQNIEVLKDSAVKELIGRTVESVISEAQARVTPENNQDNEAQARVIPKNNQESQAQEIPAFNWFQQSESQMVPQQKVEPPTLFASQSLFGGPDNSDPFAFVAQKDDCKNNAFQEFSGPEQHKKQQQTRYFPGQNQEELLDKIRDLESRLNSSEKEKNNLRMEHENLSLLLSERGNFGPANLDVVDTANIQTTDSLFAENKPRSVNFDLESQILSGIETQKTPALQKELQNIEFEQSKPCQGACAKPIVEEQVQAKAAYLCYKKEESSPQKVAIDAFVEDDDGWGLSPEETRLEEEHIQKSEATSTTNVIEELKEKIRVLELERGNHLEEIKQLQIKSGKLIKKLKEFKQKNEKLNTQVKKPETDFFSLDDTIQEELKSQIEMLEKKVKELSFELNKEKTEKASISKRIDTLTAANERMIDMKEKQDVELLSWQRKHRELSEKLQKFEWSDDGFGSEQKIKEVTPKSEDPEKPSEETVQALKAQIETLNVTLKDLILDKEELQALLDEQTALRKEAEKTRSIPQEDYMDLIGEKNELNEKYNSTLEEKKTLHEEYNKLVKDNKTLNEKLHEIEQTNYELNRLIDDRNILVDELTNNLRTIECEMSQKNSKDNTGSLQQQLETILQNKNRIEQEHVNSKQELLKMQAEKSEVSQQLQNTNVYLENLQKEFESLRIENNQLLQSVENVSSNEDYKQKLQAAIEEKALLTSQLQEKDVQISTLTQSLNSQVTNLKSDLDKQIETTKNLLQQNKSLNDNLQQRNNEFEQLSAELSIKNIEVTSMVEQLTRDWEARVDQRGADIAESWKIHLESRESEFSQMELILRKEINELEEKCNALVNENNELRKNVDAEIRNEVDRIAALQKQISDRQQIINDLTQNLQEKQDEIQRLQLEISNYEAQIAQLNQLLKDRDETILKYVADEEAIQTEFNENQEIIRSILVKLQAIPGFSSYSKQALVEEVSKIIEEIPRKNSEIIDLQQKLEVSCSKDDLQKKEEEILNLKSLLQQHKTKISELEAKYKSLEISSINAEELQKKDEALRDIYVVLDDNKAKLTEWEDKYVILENELQMKLQELTSLHVNLEEAERLKKLESDKANLLEQNLHECQQKLNILDTDLQDKSLLLAEYANSFQNYQFILNQKDEEINSLKAALDEKEHQIAYLTENANIQNNSVINEYIEEINYLKKQFEESRTHYEETLAVKENELLGSMQRLNEAIQDLEAMKHLQEELATKDATINELQQKLNEQNVLLEDENKQLTDLRAIIEDQVLKIEELKRELFSKSNDYDALIAELDMVQNPATPSPEPNEDQNLHTPPRQKQEEDDMTEPVSRAQHDLALYMLHQRDVRCEELTVELTQLLEERDTLQLRLSNAIREKEELRRRLQVDTSTTEDEVEENRKHSSPHGAVPKSRSAAIVLGATGTEMATEAVENLRPDESENRLATKLSELKTVGYRKDKSILDEQELRRMQQLSIMQSHRDLASKLPAEAAARLVDASYTLSRDVQSPSKVLLDWLWGRSTPKVNNI